jgi:penicillin-binding protein 2
VNRRFRATDSSMATVAPSRSDRSGTLVETHKSFQPRIIFFHFVIAALLLTLVVGLAYQQLINTGIYNERERVQNQRRVLVPGPRGNIYDRNNQLIVGNRPRFAVVLYLDELRQEFRREYIRVRRNYRETGDKDLPNSTQMEQIARSSVVQRYLDQVNTILGRKEQVDTSDLMKHFARQLLLPYTLVDDLTPDEYARLIESLPVRSSLQVYTSSARNYPFGSAAAHTLGYVGVDPNVDAENLPGEGLTTFKMKGSIGRDGLEKTFDDHLQGEAGGTIFLVDPAGYRINPPLQKKLPVQGKNLVTSLDIDLQLVAEKALGEFGGAAVVLDVSTGEVLALASKPDYDLKNTSPHITHAVFAEIESRGAWTNRAVQGLYAPGSTFKLVTAMAGLRQGSVTVNSEIECTGYHNVGRKLMPCHGGVGQGHISFTESLAQSCNVFYYKYGLDTGIEAIAAEARRLHLHQPTGIELPFETKRMLIGDRAWKEKDRNEDWFPGDTANTSIGQGFLAVTPLQMASMIASFARGQVHTKPTLIHDPKRTPQKTAPLGLTPAQYAAMVKGMEGTVTHGSARVVFQIPALRIPDLRIAGKTGTAQVRTAKGTLNLAWFVCFAPVEKPEIAIAVMVEGDTPDETYAGGIYAAPVAQAILKKWKEKKDRPSAFVAPKAS